MKVFADTFIFRPKTIHFWGGVRLCGQVHGVRSDAGRRPIAPSRRAWRAHVRPHLAQQRERAPGGLKRALRVLQLIYVRQRPTYAHLARPQHLLRAPATRADAALGVHLGAPVPPSEARARLGGCSAR